MSVQIVPIEYLAIDSVKANIETNGGVFQKKDLTELRIPGIDQVGQDFPTFVKDGSGIRQESSNTIKDFDIVARNPQPIGTDAAGKEIFNEWLIPSDTVRKNYGEDIITKLGDSFTSHRKVATVKAVELTQEVMSSLAQFPGQDELHIKVSWSNEPMIAKIGDFITSGGYSISQHDMNAYVKIEPVSPEIKAPKVRSRELASDQSNTL